MPLQFEDLGARLPLFTSDKNDSKWIREVVEQCTDGVNAKIGSHLLARMVARMKLKAPADGAAIVRKEVK